jgi:RNA polymerase sigma factor (TIGR02999 family)
MTLEPPQSDLTLVLRAAAAGDRQAGAALLPLVYEELRRLARARLDRTPPGNTLQPTALVHEAYLKLVKQADPGWDGRHHFFGAAARAMRDIVVDHARGKAAAKRGGGAAQVEMEAVDIALERPPEDILALDQALRRLEREDPRKAQLVLLRCFAGLTMPEAAAALEISERTAERDWSYIRAWLQAEMSGDPESEDE